MLKGMMLAASGALGGGSPPVGGDLLWSQTNKDPDIALSEGDTKALSTASGTNGVTTTDSSLKSSGKWYCELEAFDPLGLLGGCGVVYDNYNVSRYVGDNIGDIGYQPSGRIYNSSLLASGLPSYTTGDVISILFDVDTKDVEFRKNNAFVWSGVMSTFQRDHRIAMNTYNSTGGGFKLIQPSDYNYPIPAGYSAWTG